MGEQTGEIVRDWLGLTDGEIADLTSEQILHPASASELLRIQKYRADAGHGHSGIDAGQQDRALGKGA